MKTADLRVSQIISSIFIDLEVSCPEEPIGDGVAYALSEVCFKTPKNHRLAVFKIMWWKANKEQMHAGCPASVLTFIDFSPDCKEPLNHEGCLSKSRSRTSVFSPRFVEKPARKGQGRGFSWGLKEEFTVIYFVESGVACQA